MQRVLYIVEYSFDDLEGVDTKSISRRSLPVRGKRECSPKKNRSAMEINHLALLGRIP